MKLAGILFFCFSSVGVRIVHPFRLNRIEKIGHLEDQQIETDIFSEKKSINNRKHTLLVKKERLPFFKKEYF